MKICDGFAGPATGLMKFSNNNSMTTPLILLDEATGKRFEVIPPCELHPDFKEVCVLFKPYIERKPLFTDLAGQPVNEGEEVWCYVKKYSEYTRVIASANYDHNGNINISPFFLHQSDCERWVASNVPNKTLQNAYELIIDALKHKLTIEDVEKLIQEKCLLPAY